MTDKPDAFDPWRKALLQPSPPKLKKLLKAGSDVHQTDDRGRTPLLWIVCAAWMCRNKDKLAECVALLLDAGADPNVVETKSDSDRIESALMLAVRDDNPPLVRALIDAGADVQYVSKAGQTALDLATDRGAKPDIQQMLVAAGAIRSQPYTLDQAAYGGDLAAVKELLAGGAEVDKLDERGHTPLRQAAVKGHEAVFFTLLEAGADPRGIDAAGDNLLTPAACSGSEAIVTELLDRGLDVNGGDDPFNTPLMNAIHYNHLSVAKLLIAAGADTTHRNSMGQTAEKIARDCDPDVRDRDAGAACRPGRCDRPGTGRAR